MTAASNCPSGSAGGFARQLIADTDCQAFGMVERGYAALSAPGGTVGTALTGLLVIAVALFGYRLLLGRGVMLSDAVGITVKIGVVLMIATSWEAWQALAYKGLAQGPTEIANEMLIAIGAPGPIDSLQRTLDGLTQAAVGYRSRAGIASPLVGGPAAAAAVLNVSAILLTLSTVGVIVATRVVLAILLAIAPVMAGFILFDSTRGMSQGWLGAMVAAAITPMFVFLVAAVEFAIIAPMMTRLLAEQAAGRFENSSVMPIGLVTIIFVIALVFAVRAGTRIGHGIRLRLRNAARTGEGADRIEMRETGANSRLRNEAEAAPSAAKALEALARRESAPAPASAAGMRAMYNMDGGRRSLSRTGSPEPLLKGFEQRRQAHRARSAPRRSRAASRRDA